MPAVQATLDAYDPLTHLIGFPSAHENDKYAIKQQQLEEDVTRRWRLLLSECYAAVDFTEPV